MTRATMVSRVESYLVARRNLGFQLRVEGGELLRFARFADDSGHRGPVTIDIALRWAQQARTATPLYRARRLEVVRGFAKYMIALEPRTEIPPVGLLGPAHRRMPPYIFSTSEIARLVTSANNLASPHGLRGATYASLLGLLACTGLRVSEALQLRRNDADLGAGVIVVRRSKFRKSRLVPLHPSACVELRRYLARRDAIIPPAARTALFVSEAGNALPYTTVRCVCRKLIDRVAHPVGFHRRPHIHDLRHTFACQCLLRWYRQGVDVEHRIAALSTYLGHAKVSDTYWYLTGVPELMALAAARFERLAKEGGQHGSHR